MRNVVSLLLVMILTQFVVGDDRPNILFIFTDDHAPHAIGAYGGPLAALDPTPNIDQLAREGVLFRNSFCTNSICGPSRAVILTGKHSHVNGFRRNGDTFDGDQQTFPKLFQKVGYQTAIFGKWHLGSDPQGFDQWEVLPGQGSYYNPIFITSEGRHTEEGYCTDLVTDKAVSWLESARDSEKPFMLMVQHKAPHRCWMPALRHLDLYKDIKIPEPDTLFDRYEDNAAAAHKQEMSLADHLHPVFDCFFNSGEGFDAKKEKGTDKSGFRNLRRMTPQQRAAWDAAFAKENQAFTDAAPTGDELVRWKYQRYLKNYLRCVRGVDESVGRLLRTIQESGLADNTMVVYSSDQGFFLGDHGWYDKRWIYDESMKMPLVIRTPGVADAGRVEQRLVQNIDYAPTFLEFAGLDRPADLQGRSLMPILQGAQPADWRDAVYYHYSAYPDVHMVAKHAGLRTQQYKIAWFYETDEWEFYDLEKDPDELVNQYGAPEYKDSIESMKRSLESHRQKYGDETLPALSM